MRFLHFGFNFAGAVKAKELEPIFNKAPDWIRYTPHCWIVWTDRSADWWNDQVRTIITNADGVVILEVDLKTRWGSADKWIWDWMAKYI